MTLLPGPPFEPLPTGSGHYVPVLQNRKGELDALQHASAATWERMTPLIEFVGPKDASREFPLTTVRDWTKRVHEAVASHPIYLDIIRLSPSAKVITSRGKSTLLPELHGAALRRGLEFVPVVHAGNSRRIELEAARSTMAANGHGVGIRFAFLSTIPPTGTTRASLLSGLLEQLECDPTEADLLLDLDYLDPDTDIDVSMLEESIAELVDEFDWRGAALIGTTIPETLSCVEEGTLGELPRREWLAWIALSKNLKRLPAFGDYAIQHPHPPVDGGGPGMRANVRYTTDSVTLIPRAEGAVIQKGKEQYHDLCRQLVARSEYKGASYTWGDGVIEECARELIDGGSQGRWRGAGTSHHLRFVTDQLRALYP